MRFSLTMSRKTKIVLAITVMVAVMVSAFSYLYVSQVVRQRLDYAGRIASVLDSQLAFAANEAVPELADTRIDTSDPVAVREATADHLQEDASLSSVLNSIVGTELIVYDAAVVDTTGRAILHSTANMNGKLVASRPDFSVLHDARFWQQLRMLYAPSTVYEVRKQLQQGDIPFGTVRVGVSNVFLRDEITHRLQHAVYFSVVSILASLLLAALISHLALGPLKELSRNLDSVSAGQTAVVADEEAIHDEYGLVTLKVAHLGRQMRDTNQIFSALKDNVEQVMSTLQDGLMLFTRDARVVLVSASAERFLARSRREILGHTAQQIFTPDTPLGATVLQGFEQRRPILQQEFFGDRERRIQVTLDFIQEKGTQIGALLTLRDAESVRRIEDEIEMSRRLSASGRLTRGVGHEVKNPINAIVLHLQLLQNKLNAIDPDTKRHIDIIGSEIHRLDRVVQILVDFTRPRDLRLEETDLRKLLEGVAQLAGPDAEQHGVALNSDLPGEPLMVKVDSDFMKQAVLNIVLNGVQAMPQGGQLDIVARREDHVVITEISDQGGGIPQEIQDKIFELYFTTKKGGSGIGLAQTYQILQWHYGSVDFESTPGKGTTFRLRVPLAETSLDDLKEMTAKS
jgi:signal transduction histidine kinase